MIRYVWGNFGMNNVKIIALTLDYITIKWNCEYSKRISCSEKHENSGV